MKQSASSEEYSLVSIEGIYSTLFWKGYNMILGLNMLFEAAADVPTWQNILLAAESRPLGGFWIGLICSGNLQSHFSPANAGGHFRKQPTKEPMLFLKTSDCSDRFQGNWFTGRPPVIYSRWSPDICIRILNIWIECEVLEVWYLQMLFRAATCPSMTLHQWPQKNSWAQRALHCIAWHEYDFLY